jgi:hypothetical protein
MPKELSEVINRRRTANAMANRQILVALKYFVQSDWRIMVENLELPYNVKLKAQVVTDRVPSGF